MARHYATTETRRLQIAQAALEVIAHEGLGNFTTRAIAQRVGITDGTIFRHFGNKEEIVGAAMDVLEEGIDASLAPVEGDALAHLEAFFRHRAAFVGVSGSVGRLIFSDQLAHALGVAGVERVQGWRRRSVALLESCVGAIEEQGRLVPHLTVADAVQVIQGLLLTFAMAATLQPDISEEVLRQQIDRSWSTLCALLLVQPES